MRNLLSSLFIVTLIRLLPASDDHTDSTILTTMLNVFFRGRNIPSTANSNIGIREYPRKLITLYRPMFSAI